MKTTYLLGLMILLSAFAVSANAGCPALSGNYLVTATTSADNQSSPGAIISITQSGCREIDVSTNSPNSQQPPSVQKYFLDGQPHVWADVSDVSVSFNVSAQFQGNGFLGVMSSPTMPGVQIGTIGYSLDSTGKTLTFAMTTTEGGAFSATAIRQ